MSVLKDLAFNSKSFKIKLENSKCQPNEDSNVFFGTGVNSVAKWCNSYLL